MKTSGLSPGPQHLEPSAGFTHSPVRRSKEAASLGFTAVELLIVVAIIVTIMAIAVPIFLTDLDQSKTARAATEIKTLEDEILLYESNSGKLPDDLSQIGYPNFLDPWRRPYAYLNHTTMLGNGQLRKDRFNVPLNSDYDLYSVGKDGLTQPSITDVTSLDDIVRGANGAYSGLASGY
jgi:general secretion pathway protein G